MTARRWATLGLLVLLYGATWQWGPASYADAHAREVARHYAIASRSPRCAHPGGPVSEVRWCVPVLPCVMVADSYYSVGRLYGKGGTYLVLWYGCGTCDLWLGGWVS